MGQNDFVNLLTFAKFHFSSICPLLCPRQQGDSSERAEGADTATERADHICYTGTRDAAPAARTRTRAHASPAGTEGARHKDHQTVFTQERVASVGVKAPHLQPFSIFLLLAVKWTNVPTSGEERKDRGAEESKRRADLRTVVGPSHGETFGQTRELSPDVLDFIFLSGVTW